MASPRKRDWQLSFGPERGQKGERRTLKLFPEVYFIPEKVLPLEGAKITGVRIGGREQPLDTWEVCLQDEAIEIDVLFDRAGQWQCNVFGKAIF